MVLLLLAITSICSAKHLIFTIIYSNKLQQDHQCNKYCGNSAPTQSKSSIIVYFGGDALNRLLCIFNLFIVIYIQQSSAQHSLLLLKITQLEYRVDLFYSYSVVHLKETGFPALTWSAIRYEMRPSAEDYFDFIRTQRCTYFLYFLHIKRRKTATFRVWHDEFLILYFVD